MKIVPLSDPESSRLGFTHLVNLKVANGDLTTNATFNILPLGQGCFVSRVMLDIKVAWTAGTLSIGDTASGTRYATTQSLTVATWVGGGALPFVVTAASQFLTITSASITTAATSEALLYLALGETAAFRATF